MIIIIYIYPENQQWIISDKSTGIPGVFTIASKTDPSVFLTAPLDPKNEDKITLSKKIVGFGRQSQQQLWRLIPDGGGSNSVIQNYARETGLVIDIPDGNTGVPMQMYSRYGNSNQSFYIDLAAAV